MFKHILKDFGLTENEIEIYVALLGAQAMAASTLGRKTGIKRLSVYSILTSLREKGLIATFKKENVTYFSALDPEALLNICESAIAREKHKRNELEEFIQKFNSVAAVTQLSVTRPCVKFYEGETGIENARANIPSCKEKIRIDNMEINICADKILIISFKEKTGILIESREIARSLKRIFERGGQGN